ncbi:hypothetical protein BU26DRAFT_518009 [Trematosphaeria pertusa]|uniref:BTB domain-containing protein n=1 Tax=Trematosphaeria pertusa TaxID=390896 RepID=A0A6A6ILN6_9PLEO|nr:uncharacterized protein BU26DRAFT_518009 [Trematosphaeria pertusa]KAF2251316.1 hypothetical protein BU26DRAFT_518009 [Trematosphaeria pertusa]
MGPSGGLANAIKSLLASGKHSDFVITCGDDVYNVHKAILCSQSDVFDAASRFGKESEDGRMDLAEDEPEIVKYMIQYLYEEQYEVPRAQDEPSVRVVINFVDLPANKKVQARTLVEGIPSLRRDLYDRFIKIIASDGQVLSEKVLGRVQLSGDMDRLVNRQLLRLLEQAHEDSSHPPTHLFPSDRELVVHAKVYAIADKYHIDGLKTYAASAFAGAKVDRSTSPFLYDAIDVAFSTTPDEDIGLRVWLAYDVLGQLNQFGLYPRLKEKLEQVPELATFVLGLQFGKHTS